MEFRKLGEKLVNADELKIQYINITSIKTNPYQTRKQFDEQRLLELKESIEMHGILQPLVVKKKGKEYVLVAGERRKRAAELAGLKRVPVVVAKLDDKQAATATLVENLQREDIHFLEEAEGFERLLSDFDMTQNGLAKMIGRSQSYIANKVRILGLPLKVKEIISREIISERHARALLNLSSGEQQLETAKRIVEEGLSVKQTEEAVFDQSQPKNKKHEKKRGKRQLILKDTRVFINSIKKAVETLKEGGIEAKWEQIENQEDEKISLIIDIPMKKTK